MKLKRFNLPWTSRYGELLTAYQTAVGKGKRFCRRLWNLFSYRCNAYRVRSLWNDSCTALFMERA